MTTVRQRSFSRDSLRYWTACLLVSLFASSTVSATTLLRPEEVPKGDWVSYHPDVEFLPATAANVQSLFKQQQPSNSGRTGNIVKTLARQLEEGQRRHQQHRQRRQQEDGEQDYDYQEEQQQGTNMYNKDVFAEGQSDYDEYQQAWRYLGFFIDCEDSSRYSDDDDMYGYNNNHRDMGSGDKGTSDGCNRYVLWAAYVDEYYEGGGIGEYQYYDLSTGRWDDTPCSVENSNRCAKMDCHLEDTHFTLLGLFKHRSPDDWMEQLFKHEGMCIWTEEEYSFMKGARKAWPQGCIQSGYNTIKGGSIYYDIKPLENGYITLGLYSDSRCVEEYEGLYSVEQVVGNFLANAEASHDENNAADYSSLSMSEAQATWDSAFDIFKICQPCKAHDLYNYGGGEYGRDTSNNDDYFSYYAPDPFDCYDDADYTNVNQCMKFMAKTSMDTATMRDILLAYRQGSLVEELPINSLESHSRKPMSRVTRAFKMFGAIVYLVLSLALLVHGIIRFRKARRDSNFAPNWSPKEPLVFA